MYHTHTQHTHTQHTHTQHTHTHTHIYMHAYTLACVCVCVCVLGCTVAQAGCIHVDQSCYCHIFTQVHPSWMGVLLHASIDFAVLTKILLYWSTVTHEP